MDAVFGEGKAPAGSIDGYGYALGSLDAKYLPGFDKIPEDMVVCLRRSPEQDEIKYDRETGFWENNKTAFVNLVTYKR